MGKFIDLTGKTFGRLKVIERVDKEEYRGHGKSARWLCECSCENHTRTIVPSTSLISGNTKSCGCIHKEQITQLGKNSAKGVTIFIEKEDINGKYIEFEDNHGNKCQVDLEDFNIIKKISWCKEAAGYWRGKKPNGPVVRLHNFLLPEASLVDHVDRDKNNNRRYNLRTAEYFQNSANQTRGKPAKYGVHGIIPLKSGKWKAHITFKNQHYNLGTFKTKDEAIIARLRKEKELLGEFAPQRHLFEQYGI